MEKKTSVIIVAIIVCLAVLGLWFLGKNKAKILNQNGQQSQNSTGKQKVIEPLPFKITQTPADKTPDGFVKGFPLETGAKVILNESAQTALGLQSSRTFVSQKTPAENYKLYNEYLQKNGWTILTSVDTESFKSVSAKAKDGTTLDLSISRNTVTNNLEVNIVFVHPLGTK